jgi:electron transfer flavoprotein alpha subunit
VSAILIGAGSAEQTSSLIASGADRVYVTGDASVGFHPDAAVFALTQVIRNITPDITLLPHSDYGAELGPRIAFSEQMAVATGCVSISNEDGSLHMTRSCYGGKAQAVVAFRNGPGVATVRPKTQPLPEPDDSLHGEIIELKIDNQPEPRVRIRQSHREVPEGVRLEDASIVISGGRGVGGEEGFKELERLADHLGGVVGASRPACDMGWYPQSQQVGISGRTVAPELYFAVGISGADHHLAGCAGSKLLVAINNDPDANIFKHADIGIVADYREIVASLIAGIRGDRTKCQV